MPHIENCGEKLFSSFEDYDQLQEHTVDLETEAMGEFTKTFFEIGMFEEEEEWHIANL